MGVAAQSHSPAALFLENSYFIQFTTYWIGQAEVCGKCHTCQISKH